MKLITLAEVLKQMSTGEPFDITFITCDKKRRKGGEIVELTGVTQSSAYTSGSTRNIKLPGKAQPWPVHSRLIIRFNNHKVIF